MEETRSVTESHISLDGDDDWIQRKKPERYKKHTKLKKMGTATVQEDGFAGAEKRVWIYLYRIQTNTTEQNILQL